MKYCTHCGKALPEDAVFCTACGTQASPAAGSAPPYASAYASAPLPPKSGTTFRNAGLGFILPAVILLALFVMGAANPYFFMLKNLENILLAAVPCIAVALATVLPTRAKGPDLSPSAVPALSGIIIGLVMQSGGSWLAGLLLAIAAAAAVGAVNGVINGLIRVRSAVLTVLISAAVTLVVSFIVRRVAFSLSGGAPIMPDLPDIPIGLAGFLVLLIAFAIAFALNVGTKLGTPVFKNSRSVALCIVSYIPSAVIAALVGFFMLLRIRAAIPSLSMGYEPFVLFVFACLLSSRVLDNRIAPALYVLPLGLVYAMLTNVLNLNNIPSFSQLLILYVLAAIALAIAFVSRYEKKQPTGLPPA